MADDVRISTGLRNHRKTKRLRRALGAEACWSLVCLFLYAGEARWTGDLAGMTDDDIEEEADWNGAPGALVKALLDVKFLVGEPGARRIHDWQEHNPYASSKGVRIQKGKRAADLRWERERQKQAELPFGDAQSMPGACAEHATGADGQCPPAPAPAPAPSPAHPKEPKQKHEQPAAAQSRFPEFWAAYPNKKGKQEAEKAWIKRKLDDRCDELIAHVRLMDANDDGWKRGYIPHGSTYLNQARWEDVPSGSPASGGNLSAADQVMANIERAQKERAERGQLPAIEGEHVRLPR